MAKTILNELVKLKPEKAKEYSANYENFAKECDHLNEDLKAKLKSYKGPKVYCFSSKPFVLCPRIWSLSVLA